jgi:hypothetical protein
MGGCTDSQNFRRSRRGSNYHDESKLLKGDIRRLCCWDERRCVRPCVRASVRACESQKSLLTECYHSECCAGSSFTRCVYEIVYDKVDICIGDFWETTERRKLSSFTSALMQDTFRLITAPKGKQVFLPRVLLENRVICPVKRAACPKLGRICALSSCDSCTTQTPGNEQN